jgi:FkbM family methyltransferase
MKNIFSSLEIADLANFYSLNYFDIGSRGGFQNDLYPLGFAVHAVGFEPDPIEFSILQKQQSNVWNSVTILPFGLSNFTGQQTLYIPTDPQSASLLEHNSIIGEKFKKQQFFKIDRTEEIQVLSLRDALSKTKFQSIDFIKIDIEGSELSVFKSSPDIMEDVLAIKTEISFIPFRKNQPLASDVDIYLTEAGFELMDMIKPSHWRRHGYLIHPYYSDENPPYSKGQIVHADYLYFRDPNSLSGDIDKLLKLSLIAASFGYFDYALMIMERPEVSKFLGEKFNTTPIGIVKPASKAYGRRAFITAIYRQGRSFIPFVRYFKNLLY